MQKQKQHQPTEAPPSPSPPATVNPKSLLRLPQVLELIPVSRSAWWAGVKSGLYPAPVKLSANVTCWRASDILEITEGSRHE
ncbi:AlpA family phage regulatory protein [Geobacter pelophilus]|uniref:AlpA family phage regulatory protein n=1 Tax=Geoanaerobacter pelophilus TaxID=60036 RepID=A0AAW4L8J1_9BACT|nr:AlpA family phage regulatory protein [Geoanaerobacter pelophilus]MBT0664344.1 AlpA family phage regulatory protein [Geoanaerobacter pelophilus]